VHRPGFVPEVPADLADDRRHRVARELHAAVDVEAVDRLDQPERANLDEILERLAAAGVAVRQCAHERHELDESALTRLGITFAVIGAEQCIHVSFHQQIHRVAGAGRRPAERTGVALPVRSEPMRAASGARIGIVRAWTLASAPAFAAGA
jgi:hypothetical protein